MQLNQSQADAVQKAIAHWQQQQLIPDTLAAQLKQTYTVRKLDWRGIAKYAFAFAIICGLIAVISMFADRKLISLLEHLVDKIYNAPNIILAIICGGIATIFFYFAHKNGQKATHKIFTNEGFILAGSAFTAFASANLAKLIGEGNIYYITTFLIAGLLYLFLSQRLKSALIWLFTLLAFSCCLVALSGAAVDWKPYFLGMNIPIRLTLFSGLFLVICLLYKNKMSKKHIYRMSVFYGLLLFFCSLWFSSILGNQGRWESWTAIRQIQLWPWAAAATIISALAAYIGFKRRIYTLRNFGIVFFFINIYTRYFEYCWNGSYKALFFIVLALSFWLIGRSAEKIWNTAVLNKRPNHNPQND